MRPADIPPFRNVVWGTLAAISAIGAAWAAREAATAVWRRISDADPDQDPADRTVSWSQAAAWAVLAGVSGGLARIIARRSAAVAWEGLTGEVPPGIHEI